jgi:hypothetical protein
MRGLLFMLRKGAFFGDKVCAVGVGSGWMGGTDLRRRSLVTEMVSGLLVAGDISLLVKFMFSFNDDVDDTNFWRLA